MSDHLHTYLFLCHDIANPLLLPPCSPIHSPCCPTGLPSLETVSVIIGFFGGSSCHSSIHPTLHVWGAESIARVALSQIGRVCYSKSEDGVLCDRDTLL